MTVIDLSIVAGRSDHLNDEIIWQTQLAAEPTIDTEEATEGCLARLSLRLLQYLLDIGLGMPRSSLRSERKRPNAWHRPCAGRLPPRQEPSAPCSAAPQE